MGGSQDVVELTLQLQKLEAHERWLGDRHLRELNAEPRDEAVVLALEVGLRRCKGSIDGIREALRQVARAKRGERAG